MKTIYIVILIILGEMFFSNNLLAQTQSTNPLTLTVNLSTDVISISLGADPNVEFLYDAAGDYTTTQTVTKTGHVTVVSNQEFDLAVAARSNFTSNGTGSLNLNVVSVSVDPSTLNGGSSTAVALALAATGPGTTLVTGADPSSGAVFNINYSIPNVSTLLGLANQIFTTTVVYTATQL